MKDTTLVTAEEVEEAKALLRGVPQKVERSEVVHNAGKVGEWRERREVTYIGTRKIVEVFVGPYRI